MNERYDAGNIIKNAWPEWEADASGGWIRTWIFELTSPPTDAQLDASLNIDELSVVMFRDDQPNRMRVRARTMSNPRSDAMFFDAAYALFVALERVFGRIVSIQGQPRDLWRPFRK